jgi:hypothetical protein
MICSSSPWLRRAWPHEWGEEMEVEHQIAHGRASVWTTRSAWESRSDEGSVRNSSIEARTEMRTEVELCEGEAPLLRRQERGDSLRQKRQFLDFESQRNKIGKTTNRSEQSLLLKWFEQCGVVSVFVILIVESIFLREESNSKRSREKKGESATREK